MRYPDNAYAVSILKEQNTPMGKMFREIYQIFNSYFRCESRSRPSVDNCKMIWADVGPRMLNPIIPAIYQRQS